MMFKIWKDVFVVRIGTDKSWVIGMRLSIIPGYLVCIVPQLISVIFDHNRPFVK